MENSDKTWNACFKNHFDSFLGKSIGCNTFEHSHDSPRIKIFGYDNNFGGCRAFCSIGLSEYEEVIGERAEIFLPVDEGWDDVPAILGCVISYIIQNSMRIGWGLSVRFYDVFPVFSEKFDKSAIYLSLPFDVPEGFEKVMCDTKRGHIYLAFFISESEFKYFETNKADKFETLLEQKSIDVFNITRKSCI